jgi:hypothetical protein
MNNNNFDEQAKKVSLWYSFRDGVFASIMQGLVQDYFTPFLLAVGGTVRQVGILSALSNFSAAVFQLRIAEVTQSLKSRKKTMVGFVLFQAVSLLLLFGSVVFAFHQPWTVIILAALFVTTGAMSAAPWGSLMADTVDEDKRGEYFGWRNKVLGLLLITMSLVTAVILNYSKKVNVLYGFAAIFAIAGVSRFVSGWFLSKMHEPPYQHDETSCFTFLDFITRLRYSNFARFTVFVALMNFAVYLSSPFFTVLMLKDLSFSYLLFGFLTVASSFTMYFTMKRWGEHADKVGNFKIVKMTSQLLGIVPLLWLVSRNPAYLFFAQVFSGFVWSGFNLCTSNFIYDAVSPQKRTRCIAYFNLINGIGIGAGALLGGVILPYLPHIQGNQILGIITLSGLMRLVLGFFVIKMIREVRQVRHISYTDLVFGIIGLRAVD